MANVWRVRLQSGKDGVDHASARKFVIETGVVGAGWGLDDAEPSLQLPDRTTDYGLYLRRAKEWFGRLGDTDKLERAANIFGVEMQQNDYCWAYVSHVGEYWCGRVAGEFEYRAGGDFDRYDVHMTRRCRWALVGTADAAPGVIRRAFAGPFGTVTRLVTATDVAIEAAEIALGTRAPSKNRRFL